MSEIDTKYFKAWELVQQGNYYKAKEIFEALDKEDYWKASYDLAGFYYYGLYGFEKDIKKAIKCYEKSFLRSGKLEILEELLYAKREHCGKLKTLLYTLTHLILFYKAKEPKKPKDTEPKETCDANAMTSRQPQSRQRRQR